MENENKCLSESPIEKAIKSQGYTYYYQFVNQLEQLMRSIYNLENLAHSTNERMMTFVKTIKGEKE